MVLVEVLFCLFAVAFCGWVVGYSMGRRDGNSAELVADCGDAFGACDCDDGRGADPLELQIYEPRGPFDRGPVVDAFPVKMGCGLRLKGDPVVDDADDVPF